MTTYDLMIENIKKTLMLVAAYTKEIREQYENGTLDLSDDEIEVVYK